MHCISLYEIVFFQEVSEIQCALFQQNNVNSYVIYNNYIELNTVFYTMIIFLYYDNIHSVGQACPQMNTHIASLQTSRQQVVFARLVTSCQQAWNKLLTTCNNLVDIIRLVTRLFQQGCYNHDVTILLQPCVVNLVTFLLHHDCIRLVRTTL